MSKIYLVTNQFPYSFSEQFLETEIKFWSESEIEIIPTRLGDDIRDVNGIHVRTSIAQRFGSYNKLSWLHLTKTIFSLYLLEELLRSPKLLFSFSKLKNLFRFEYLTQRYYSAVLKEFTKEELNHSLFYTYWFSWATCALSRLKKEYNFKLITRCHRVDLYKYAQPSNYMPYNKKYAKNIDVIYSISNDGVAYLENEYNIDLTKIELSRLGVLEQSNNIKPVTNNANIMHVVSVSYVKPVKRVLLIARMLQEYAEKNPNNIISWTHFGDGEQYEELKTITNSMAIKVKLQGMRSNAEVLEFYQENHVDLFVNLSISEGVPVSIMEAISFGIPVLATDSGGTKEIVTKNVGSLIKVDFTYPEFSKALKESRAKLRREVLEYSRLNYCSSTNYPDFIKRLHELCF